MATMFSENTTDIQLGCIPYCLNLSQGNALMYSRQIHEECTELDQACKSVKDYVCQHLFCIWLLCSWSLHLDQHGTSII